MSSEETVVITEEILDKAAEMLVNSYGNVKALTDFLSDLDTINTFGYFTFKGLDRYKRMIFANPAQQETRIEILQILNTSFVQQGINIFSMSSFVAEIYTPLRFDEDLHKTYVNLMPEYKNSILETYGALFIQGMMLRVLSMRIVNLLAPKLVKETEAQSEAEIAKTRKEYIDSLPEGGIVEGVDNE